MLTKLVCATLDTSPVMDDEQAMVEVIGQAFPSGNQIYCTRHVLNNIVDHLTGIDNTLQSKALIDKHQNTELS